MTAFVPIFATAFIGLSPATIGTVLTIAIIANSLLQVPSGSLADKFNRKYMVILGSLGLVLNMILMPQANGFWLLLAIMVLGSVSDACATPPAIAAIVQEGRKYGMGVATSVSNMGMGLGMGLAPILAGFIVDSFDVRAAFYVSAALGLIFTAGFVLFTRRTARI
jgi:MFS family permease